MTEGTLFTVNEVELARACVGTPGRYRLTEPELRACRAVIAWDERGTVMHIDDIAIARHLFETLGRVRRRESLAGGGSAAQS